MFHYAQEYQVKVQSTTLDCRLLQCPTKQGNYKINATLYQLKRFPGRREGERERGREGGGTDCTMYAGIQTKAKSAVLFYNNKNISLVATPCVAFDYNISLSLSTLSCYRG